MTRVLALRELIDDRPEDGVFRVSRSLFRDPDLFELEMKHVFEGGWIFIGLNTQAENPHDYFTSFIGRVPIIVSRDGDGELRCFVNACPHKGVRLVQKKCGNARRHVCPYHSWTFDSSGTNRNIKWKKSGCYSPAFDEENHDLAQVARFGEYRGFLFASLNPDVPSLEEFLGESRKLLDLIVDKSPEGVELVPGRVVFTYAANWKMQLENCSDQYHFTSTHPSYIRILDQRAKEKNSEVVQATLGAADFWQEEASGISGGTYSFDHGHVLNCPAGFRKGGGAGAPAWDGEAQLDVQYAQPDHLPEPAGCRKCIDPDAGHSADRAEPHRNAHLVHRSAGGKRRGARPADPPI
jgi:benzoate/toluate 1,2-dioxygenase alpha subunit